MEVICSEMAVSAELFPKNVNPDIAESCNGGTQNVDRLQSMDVNTAISNFDEEQLMDVDTANSQAIALKNVLETP